MRTYARAENEIIPQSIITWSVLGKKCASKEVCCNDLNSAFVDQLSLQEWELEEWDENHAKFAFFMKTVELETSFGSMPAGKYKAKGLRNSESTGFQQCVPRDLLHTRGQVWIAVIAVISAIDH